MASSTILRRRLEVLANVIVVITCLVVGAIVVTRWINERNDQRTALSALPPVYPAGFRLSAVPEFNYGDTELTILVGLSSTCKFCEESMPLLRRLSAELPRLAGSRGRLISVGTEPKAVLSEYVRVNRLSAATVISVDRNSTLAAVATRTPSIVLIDKSGTVLASWPGLVTEDRLNELLGRLRAELLRGTKTVRKADREWRRRHEDSPNVLLASNDGPALGKPRDALGR